MDAAENRFVPLGLPFDSIWSARSGAVNRSTGASPRAAASCGEARSVRSRQVEQCGVLPLHPVATTGQPQLMASSSTMGKASISDGSTKASSRMDERRVSPVTQELDTVLQASLFELGFEGVLFPSCATMRFGRCPVRVSAVAGPGSGIPAFFRLILPTKPRGRAIGVQAQLRLGFLSGHLAGIALNDAVVDLMNATAGHGAEVLPPRE